MPNSDHTRTIHTTLINILHERKEFYGLDSDSYLDVLSNAALTIPEKILANKSLTCPVEIARAHHDWRAVHALHLSGYACASVLVDPALASISA